MYKPNYSITPKILNGISEIAEVKALVEKARVLPLNEAQLRRQALIRMAHTSTSIEGNKLAEFQVEKVLSGQPVYADEKSIIEVRNYQLALKEMDALITERKQLSIDLILSLHKLLMTGLLEEEKMGHLRPGEIYIVDDLGEGKERVRYQGPPAKKVAFLVQELLNWLHDAQKEGLHPVLQAAVFHIQFVTIHPFADGNGRLTRLLTTLVLYQRGWDFKKILVLEDFYNQNRMNYYNALNSVQGHKYHDNEDITSWIEYFVSGFVVEAEKVSEKIKMISFNQSPSDQQIFLDKDEIMIMDFVSTTGRITSADVMEILPIAKRTAQMKLGSLIEKKLITPHGKGPSTFYTLAQ